MTNIFDVASYIVNKCGSMSVMKLQKLLYYCQAMSLVWDDVPLFKDDFEAWAKGPVCRGLNDIYKGKFIIENSYLLEIHGADMNNLNKDQKETVDAVVKPLKEYSPYQLYCMIQEEDPWRNADLIITKESMLEYYSLKYGGNYANSRKKSRINKPTNL